MGAAAEKTDAGGGRTARAMVAGRIIRAANVVTAESATGAVRARVRTAGSMTAGMSIAARAPQPQTGMRRTARAAIVRPSPTRSRSCRIRMRSR